MHYPSLTSDFDQIWFGMLNFWKMIPFWQFYCLDENENECYYIIIIKDHKTDTR